MASIVTGPHYEIHSTELAAWLEKQGKDRWWNVDGDPLLTGRLEFPCPADELAEELRRLNRPLLVQAKTPDARGQQVDRNQIDAGPVPIFRSRIGISLPFNAGDANHLLFTDAVIK